MLHANMIWKRKKQPSHSNQESNQHYEKNKKIFFAIHDCYLFIDEFKVDSRIGLAWIELGFDSILFIYLSFLCSFYLFFFSCLVVFFFSIIIQSYVDFETSWIELSIDFVSVYLYLWIYLIRSLVFMLGRRS